MCNISAASFLSNMVENEDGYIKNDEALEFRGDLRGIAPVRLVGKGDEEIENFFLVMSLIFNDLKGLIYFDLELRTTRRKPTTGEVTTHAGEFGGLSLQLYKLQVGLVSEFLVFLKENEKVLSTYTFKNILKKLPADAKTIWCQVEQIALESTQTKHVSDFSKILISIRSNLAHHYYQSGKPMRKGFIGKFIENDRDATSSKAYYSIGENMESTRFYYADAAMQEYLLISAKRTYDSGVEGYEDFNLLQNDVNGLIRRMNVSIQLLLKEYLRSRPY